MKNNERNYLKQFEEVEFIPSEELNSVVVKAQEGDKAALTWVVTSFQFFIVHVAKKSGVWHAVGMYTDDIISAGNIGLLLAIKNFDSSKNVSFTPYAKVCIRGSIYDFLNSNHQITYSKKVIQDINKISKNKAECNLSEEQISELSEYKYSFSSLYKTSKTGSEYNICDAEGKFYELTPENEFLEKELHSSFHKALSTLNSRERFIVQSAHGINCKKLSYTEIGKVLNISKQRVGQIYLSAIKKLKVMDRQFGLSDYIAA